MGSQPAPVRAQWLGWAGTTGDTSVQTIVTDGIISPWTQRNLYLEKLLVLPRCY